DGGVGHTNWETVTYKGPIFWEDHSNPTFGDDDYNFLIDTPDSDGVTSGGTRDNQDRVKLEFQARETIDHFDNTTFWNQFHQAVDDDDQSARNLVDGKEAVAIGLLGLDREHESKSEIHPVYALAIHTSTNPADDTWAIFVRNYGNEGWCSE